MRIPGGSHARAPDVTFTLQEPTGSGRMSQACLLTFLLGGVLRREEQGLGAGTSGSAICWLCELDQVPKTF